MTNHDANSSRVLEQATRFLEYNFYEYDHVTAEKITASIQQRRGQREGRHPTPPPTPPPSRQRPAVAVQVKQQDEPTTTTPPPPPLLKWISNQECLRSAQESWIECWVARGNWPTTRPHRAKLRLVLREHQGPLLDIEHLDMCSPVIQSQEDPTPTNIDLHSVGVALEQRLWRQQKPPLQRRIIRFKPLMASSKDTDVFLTCVKTPEGRDCLSNWYRALAWAARHG